MPVLCNLLGHTHNKATDKITETALQDISATHPADKAVPQGTHHRTDIHTKGTKNQHGRHLHGGNSLCPLTILEKQVILHQLL